MTGEKFAKHNSFLLTQIELTQKRIIKPIYRGDSLCNLCLKLNVKVEKETFDIFELLRRLFMVGEKSRRFLAPNRNFQIDQIDDYVFEEIFKYFGDSLKNKRSGSVNFFNKNLPLKEFFSKKQNKSLFIKIIKEANEIEKTQIRNYYLTLLHQLGAVNYKKKSHFVSTTKKYSIAKQFTDHDKSSSQIILHCWQPIKLERQTIKKYGLPKYYDAPYINQKEISFLGGIIPHFISGIEIESTNRFYPNPAIFENTITEETFLKGLLIDQTNFDDVLALTNYHGSMATDGEKIWERKKRFQ